MTRKSQCLLKGASQGLSLGQWSNGFSKADSIRLTASREKFKHWWGFLSLWLEPDVGLTRHKSQRPSVLGEEIKKSSKGLANKIQRNSTKCFKYRIQSKVKSMHLGFQGFFLSFFF